ncbi:MAG TPA: cardiolipin synthase [Spongiibacteraceae bacterium]|nr:cardiolipin synthase [Spongiibacteraceae bacterium]
MMIDSVKHWLGNLDVFALAAYGVIIQLLGIAAALEAIMKTRTSQGAIAWSLSLLLLPTLMVPLYWIFGRRKFRGYAKARRLGKRGLRLPQLALDARRPAQLEPYQAVLEQIAQMPFTQHNQVQLLIDGEQIFATLFAAIERAQHYILLQYYIVRGDATGQLLRERLLAKTRAGVAVYFLYDEVGSFQLGNAFIESLRQGGVDIRSFHSTKGRRNRFQLNFRNHRKIVVVDGEVAMVGGNNIGDEYRHLHPILTPWRDTSVALSGPAALALQLTFLEDWYWACELIPQLHWTLPAITTLGSDMLVVPTGPADHLETCLLFFQQLAQSAQRRLWIVSPYFVPDNAVINALQLAALRGVDVRILLPEKADKRTVWLSSFASLGEVQNTGVQVYRYQAGFLHQKVWLMDDDCAVIGTANLDNRSFRLNFEVGLVIRDRSFAQQVEKMLIDDFANSTLVQRDALASRSLLFRIAVRCSYLLAPIL